jgi:rhodanese-related sulfurtransferase
MANLNKSLHLILLALLLALALFLSVGTSPYNSINNNQLQVMLENNVPIYDVRRPEEWYETGVIVGSQLATYVDADGRVKPDFLNRFTADIGKNDPVILICRTGSRTSRLAHYLVEELGYTNVFNVEDGIVRWISENRSVQIIKRPTFEIQYLRGLI